MTDPTRIVRYPRPRGAPAAFAEWLLALPAGPRRVKPEEVLWGLDERPPPAILLGVAAQHVLVALMVSVFGVLAARGIGLGPRDAASFVAACMFWLGIGTLLYGLRSRFTPGILLVNIPSSAALATFVAVTGLHGPAATAGAFLAANVLLFLLAGYLPRLRAYFPPEVIGVVVLMLGVSLITQAVGGSVGMDSGGPFSLAALAVSLATLAGIIWASVWGSPRIRVMAMLIGTVAGVLGAFATGLFDLAAVNLIAGLPAFAPPLPGRDIGWPVLVPAAILPVVLIELLGATRQAANTLTIDKLNDAKWRRADMALVARAVRTLALCNIPLAAMGLITAASASSNVGLARASGVMSRYVAIVAGAMMAALAFVPAVSTLIVLTPGPVVGGILIYTAAFMIVAGMDLILSRMLNVKRSFTVGISIVIGLGIYVLPGLVATAPEWSLTIVSSGLSVAALVAIGLNLLFRIGVSQTASLLIDLREAGAGVAEFLEHWGKAWGARREVILRAGMAIGEALEVLERTGAAAGHAELLVRFDEVTLVCTLRYSGEPLRLGAAEVDVAALLDTSDEEIIDAQMRQVSAQLVTRLADRVRAEGQGGAASLTLQFEH